MMEPDPEWDAIVRHAPMSDSHSRCTDSWVPPVEELLWRTARASALVRFFPFSSHNCLRLATSSDFATAETLGPCIVYCYDDFKAPDRRPEYWVRDVWPQDPSREPVLRTYDVDAAVRELERLTADFTPAA
ncbi:hypothetical protein [Streptomyces sp. NBC_00273]|uniref:hypothetical protein n=1 Tax=Streptomyces sp. NBC_00273 TaxID=2903644 RepID=UPI002E29CBF5|nr:hypothetical protein [Streptomyces sp. NBC_00273]